MDDQGGLADRFEAQRGRLRAVAYRMLGSAAEADDAVQETWLRLSRTDPGTLARVANLPAWLTTVLSRICLDLLRIRASRREDLVGGHVPDHVTRTAAAVAVSAAEADARGPEEEALLAESVGRALLVVLDTLTPTERVAFVLHDSFAVPFDRIAPLVERSPVATKKLASRARGKVRGTPALPAAELARHRHVVEAFLAAARGGDLDALLAVLAPDVVRRADPAALPPGAAAEIHGADAVARETVLLTANARHAALALVDGAPGIVVAPRGRLVLALRVTVAAGRVTSYEVIAGHTRLRRLALAVVPD
ncbi:sigma-70 family RNA polymerase sigma factor [Streptomyces silvensis]|uniref:RNA polymerase subunit sigma-70 n=1 Tax=Streptomyces silvensis TaxID=1765722 RepID=A0A0W7X9M9_9ACTN|nr:sigma-70 family RNA polymerase sigma factor [Streptomyces silvensis]KUF19605.1 RNA polymerase subunit sigma-70 [Streptomyces silvensis]